MSSMLTEMHKISSEWKFSQQLTSEVHKSMHKYAQYSMSYVKHYSTSDLSITFTCDLQWIEIQQELFPGLDRHESPRESSNKNLNHCRFHFDASRVQRDMLLDVFNRVAKTQVATCTHFHLVDREVNNELNQRCYISENSRWRRSRLAWSRH